MTKVERGSEGAKERTSQMSLCSVHTDWDKTGMPGPKGRATVVVVVCQDSLQLLGAE